MEACAGAFEKGVTNDDGRGVDTGAKGGERGERNIPECESKRSVREVDRDIAR